MFSSPESTNRRVTPELLATILLLLAYIVWILSLPAWPSQDGPIHLYYVHVLRELLSHHATVYSRYYTIKHVLPPYALYYYALLALSKFCSLLLADRLVLCAYLALFVFGFRYLAQAIGPSADRSTLLAVLIALNWSAGMGFLNYCLSLALVLWAMGLWLRFTERSLGRRLTFLLLVVAITLTHPVPLLFLLAFCGVDWLQRVIFQHKTGEASQRTRFKADLVVLLLSALALLYVRHFAMPHAPQSAQGTYISQVAYHVLSTLKMHHLALILGPSLPIRLYLFGALATLGIGYALAIAQRRRNHAARRWTAGDTWLVYSIILLVVVPLLPSNISDAFYFEERLSILLWLAPLLAASGWTYTPASSDREPRAPSSRQLLPAAWLAFALITNLCLLWQGNAILRPIAAQMTSVAHSPQDHAGQLALILEDPREGGGPVNVPSWNPFYWAEAHVLRRDEAVLDNSPWLDAAIIPLGARPALPLAAASTGNDISPHALSLLMSGSPTTRAQILTPVNLVLITQSERLEFVTRALSLLSTPGGKQWECHSAAAWYQLCEPASRP